MARERTQKDTTGVNLQLPAEVYDVARIAAASRQQSLRALILDAVREKLLRLGTQDAAVKAALDRAAK